ncbi:hypothetical protein F4810DRAFT_448667 [Camillea tinctor]|nr:hypothetical protein F4810DRAFT_448667 [Camillea tinctor]
MNDQIIQQFLTDEERLRFRTLTVLLQYTNPYDHGTGDSMGKITTVEVRCKGKYIDNHTWTSSFAKLLARGNETIAVHLPHNRNILRVAVSTPTTYASQKQQSGNESKDENCDSFEHHCFLVAMYIKDAYACLPPCLGQRAIRESTTGAGTQYTCSRELCKRCDLRLKLQTHVVKSSHELMRQRLDFGKLCHGRNIFWTLTRPVREILRMTEVLEFHWDTSFGRITWIKANGRKFERFFSSYPGLWQHWHAEAPEDMPQGYSITSKEYQKDEKYGIVPRFLLMFHCALRFILLELDEGLQSGHTDQVLRAISALDILRIEYIDDLRTELKFLKSLYMYKDTTSFHSKLEAARAYTVPNMAKHPCPLPSHPLYSESSTLDSIPWSHWNITSMNYIFLLLSHELAMHTLTTISFSNSCKVGILRTLPIEVISYTPAPRLAGRVLAPDDVIRDLPVSNRLQNLLHLHIADYQLFSNSNGTAGTGVWTTPGTEVHCHAEMQMAMLHQLGMRLPRVHHLAYDENKQDDKNNKPTPLPFSALHQAREFRSYLEVLGSARSTCMACRLVLEAEQQCTWIVPIMYKEVYWQACDLPGWTPRWIGTQLISFAEQELCRRLQNQWGAH